MSILTENFIEKIESGDSKASLTAVDDIIAAIPANDELAVEIVTPSVITSLHEKLIEHLGVNPRAMKLNRRFPGTKQRALMFARAMRNGIVHTIDEE